ncbi:MAG: DUF4203 domain-containing protein [Planctomycetota bacterium]
MSNIILSLAILGGAVMCFFGIRLFKVVLGVAGLVLGAAVAAYFAVYYTVPPEQVPPPTYAGLMTAIELAHSPMVLFVWAVAGGVAGALLSVFLHHAGVFVLGAWLGKMLAELTTAGTSRASHMMVLAILVLIGGVLALVMRKTIIIVSTALNGACALMFGVYALLQKSPSPQQAVNALRQPGNDRYVLLGCAVILAVIGTYVQFATAPKEKKEDPVYKKVKPKSGS